MALELIILDGRIHPARIEVMVEKAQKEVETLIKEEGEAATLEVGVHGIHPELVRLLGKLRFRTSYGQNVLKHSIEVAQLSGLLAGEIGLDVRLAKRAGLLHDIGKSIDHDVEGSHIQIGVDLHFTPNRRKLSHRLSGHKNPVAHAAYIYDHFIFFESYKLPSYI